MSSAVKNTCEVVFPQGDVFLPPPFIWICCKCSHGKSPSDGNNCTLNFKLQPLMLTWQCRKIIKSDYCWSWLNEQFVPVWKSLLWVCGGAGCNPFFNAPVSNEVFRLMLPRTLLVIVNATLVYWKTWSDYITAFICICRWGHTFHLVLLAEEAAQLRCWEIHHSLSICSAPHWVQTSVWVYVKQKSAQNSFSQKPFVSFEA